MKNLSLLQQRCLALLVETEDPELQAALLNGFVPVWVCLDCSLLALTKMTNSDRGYAIDDRASDYVMFSANPLVKSYKASHLRDAHSACWLVDTLDDYRKASRSEAFDLVKVVTTKPFVVTSD